MVDTPPPGRLQPIEVHPDPQSQSPPARQNCEAVGGPVPLVFQSHHRLHNLLPRTEEYSTLSQFVLSGRFDLPAPDPFPPFPPCTQRTPLSEKFFFLHPRQSPHSSGTIFPAPKATLR